MNAPSDRTAPKPPERLSIAYRILLHIARQGRYGPNEVPPRALCQAGMVEALGVTQGALVGFLQELVAAGVLSVHRDHVRGIDRRVKVYELTPEGDVLVLEIRRRQTPPPSPFGAPVGGGANEGSG